MSELGRSEQSQNVLVDYRLTMIEQTLKAISDNLTQLAALEQKHIETREALARAFTQIGKQDDRLRVIETEMPTLKLVRGWVVAGALGIIGLLGLTVVDILKRVSGV